MVQRQLLFPHSALFRVMSFSDQYNLPGLSDTGIAVIPASEIRLPLVQSEGVNGISDFCGVLSHLPISAVGIKSDGRFGFPHAA